MLESTAMHVHYITEQPPNLLLSIITSLYQISEECFFTLLLATQSPNSINNILIVAIPCIFIVLNFMHKFFHQLFKIELLIILKTGYPLV